MSGTLLYGTGDVIASAAWSVPLLRLMQRSVGQDRVIPYLPYLAWHLTGPTVPGKVPKTKGR